MQPLVQFARDHKIYPYFIHERLTKSLIKKSECLIYVL